jgi:hypothetical protein
LARFFPPQALHKKTSQSRQILAQILGQTTRFKYTTLIYLRKILITILLTVFIQTVFGTTWSAAYPYTQQIDGQNVIIKAFPYDPYSASPMIGVTKVYFNKKLLYTINKYYRERIFTSNDGQYLVVVHTSNSAGITSYTSFGSERLNFNQTAIEVFKNGQPFKTYTLKDVVDTTLLLNNGRYFYWGYNVNFKAFDKVKWTYNYWNKILTKREMSKCRGNLDTSYHCRDYRNSVDSMKIFELENFIYNNSIFIKDNSLHILTNQSMVVKLDFTDITIQQLPIDKIILDKNNFNPPKLKRKYIKVKLPNKFDQPKLKDGRSLEKGIADLFNLSVLDDGKGKVFTIYIKHLVIEQNGKCIKSYGEVYDKRISEYLTQESRNNEMTEKLNRWIKEQTFSTKLIPKGFDGYSFLCFVNLK